MLTERQVENILAEGLTLEGDVHWSPQPNNSSWIEFGAFLDSPRETSIRLKMAVSVLQPEKYKLIILRGEQVLRRLDVRGSHRNPVSAGGNVWHRSTHKHRWCDLYADKEAYSPSDITADAFDRSEYERTFREFCGECNVAFGGTWQDPPEPRQETLDL